MNDNEPSTVDDFQSGLNRLIADAAVDLRMHGNIYLDLNPTSSGEAPEGGMVVPAYLPMSCALTDAPSPPIPWRRRLRWRISGWWSRLRMRLGSWVAGVDLEDEEP